MSLNSSTESRDTDQDVIPHWHDPEGESLSLVEGSGACVYDEDGTEYLDFLSQLYCVNAGHGNERIEEAIVEQLDGIAYVSSSKGNNTRDELARRLVEVAPDRLTDVFFSVSGSEANEAAAQIVREYTGATKILTRWRSYHGATYGAASLTGDPQTRSVLERHAATTGSGKFLPPLSRAFDGATGEELARKAADHLEFVLRNEGPEEVAAILMEPVGGTSGAYPAPPGYFERVRELCDEYDVLLISDEVITGFGRCGEWFGIQTEGVEPDLVTFAKGVTSAYVPLAGVLARGDIGEWLAENGIDVGQTFAGHPVACAAGIGAMDAYADGMIENVREHEAQLREGLEDFADRYDVITSVHGRGFLWGVEFADPKTGEHFHDPRTDDGEAANPAAEVRKVAREEGVLFGSGRPDVQVVISPPLCVDAEEIDVALEALEMGIERTF
jgi:taurine---2-oxoglutarate transaminase